VYGFRLKPQPAALGPELPAPLAPVGPTLAPVGPSLAPVGPTLAPVGPPLAPVGPPLPLAVTPAPLIPQTVSPTPFPHTPTSAVQVQHFSTTTFRPTPTPPFVRFASSVTPSLLFTPGASFIKLLTPVIYNCY
jgi:pyruvate dehydrogenase E2 component (dihydrolipoamide acetyltransferase)